MKNHEANRLQILVLNIVWQHPDGINHAQIVRSVLQAGYRHTTGSLSADLMRIIKFMVRKGTIQKNSETRLVTPGNQEVYA